MYVPGLCCCCENSTNNPLKPKQTDKNFDSPTQQRKAQFIFRKSHKKGSTKSRSTMEVLLFEKWPKVVVV